jgi:hypothetical protein
MTEDQFLNSDDLLLVKFEHSCGRMGVVEGAFITRITERQNYTDDTQNYYVIEVEVIE